MAERKVVLCFSDSMLAIGAASLSSVSAATFSRWTGQTWTAGSGDISIPDVEMLTLTQPYGAFTSLTVASGITASTIKVEATGPFAATNITQWVYVATGTGAGQWRVITAITDTETASISPNWTTTPSAGDIVHLWTDSYQCAGVTTSDTTADTTSITKDSSKGPNFASGDIGKFIQVVNSSVVPNGQQRRIVEFVGVDEVKVSPAFRNGAGAITNLADDDGFRLLSQTGTVNGTSTLLAANASVQPMRFYQSTTEVFYETGKEYPNYYGAPLYSPYAHTVLNIINPVPELMWRMRANVAGKIYGISHGYGGATLAPFYIANLGATSGTSWVYDTTHNDFHPGSTTGLYSALLLKLQAMKSLATNAGDTMNVIGVFTSIGTNDAINTEQAEVFEEAMRNLVTSLRTYLAENSMTTVKASDIPWVTTTVPTARTNAGTVNSALTNIAADDAWFGLVDITNLSYAGDNVHLDATGVVDCGELLYEKWVEISRAASDAVALDASRLTLSDLRTRVKRRFERSTTSNAATSTMVDMFINDALREVYNTIGDNAWFLRRIETMSLSGTYPNTITLSRPVQRLLRVENSAYPGMRVVWKGLAYTAQGKLQIVLPDQSLVGSSYVVHYIEVPPDLSGEQDRTLVPSEYSELVVMLACKRLVEAAGNASLGAYYAGESERLWKYVKRDCLRRDRHRQESMTAIESFDSWRGGPSETTDTWGL